MYGKIKHVPNHQPVLVIFGDGEKSAIENRPKTIVDLPNLKMVIFYSYVSLSKGFLSISIDPSISGDTIKGDSAHD